MDGRLRGALDVYTSRTTELLLDKKLPVMTGFNQITTNVGSLKTMGFDFSINSANVETASFTWNTTLNVSYSPNEIVSLTGEKIEMTDDDGNTYMAEPDDIDNGWFIGENKDVIWDFEIDGVYQEGEEAEASKFGLYPGDFRYVDQNGDGVINAEDKIFQGLTSPPWYITLLCNFFSPVILFGAIFFNTGRLINDFNYKGFDLGVVFLAKLGYRGGTIEPFNNRQEYIKNHNWYKLPYWTPNNPINDAARINSINLGGADIWQQRSYVRFQNLSLGYAIPANLLETANISSARVAFTIDNVAIFTKWVEGDPESQREMPRTYSFSVNFSF